MATERLDPHNLEAEESVLGACLIDPDAIPKVSRILEAGDFYDQNCRLIWQAMAALHERGEPVDVLTVSDKMGSDEIPLLTKLTNQTPTSIHAEHYARMVARDATRRRLLDASGKIAKAAYDDNKALAEVEELALQMVLNARRNGHDETKPLSQLAREYYDLIESLARSDGVLGIPTGYRDIDTVLGGLQRSDLVLLAARPRIGKTSLALCIARNIAQTGKRVLFHSLEMSEKQLMRRLYALESNIGISTLKTGKLLDTDWPPFMQATDRIDKLPIWVDDTPGVTPSYIRATAMTTEAQSKSPLDLIIVDYLQLMKPDRRQPGRYEAVTEIGQALKKLAMDLNVPVLALSQLNRACESRSDKRPKLHDLRESGDLEQVANVVMLLYRDEIYDPNTAVPNTAEVEIAKNRDGSEGTAHLYFRKHLAQFLTADIERTEIL